MAQTSKRTTEARKAIDRTKQYMPEEAIALLKAYAAKLAKFDEAVDIAINLGVDPKQTEQSVRGAVVLPAGTGRTKRILVFAKGDKEQEAKDAGADFVGNDELIEKVKEGWLEFDTIIATPQMMGAVGKLGKILGKRGLMPNPKTGTVTADVKTAIADAKKGRVEFKLEKKGALVHATIGKISFTPEQIAENLRAFIDAVLKAKPPSARGTYLKKIALSTTMSPSVKLDPSAFATATK